MTSDDLYALTKWDHFDCLRVECKLIAQTLESNGEDVAARFVRLREKDHLAHRDSWARDGARPWPESQPSPEAPAPEPRTAEELASAALARMDEAQGLMRRQVAALEDIACNFRAMKFVVRGQWGA